MKGEFKKAGTLQLTGIHRLDRERVCVREREELMAADGGYLWRSMWILWMTSSTSASVSQRSRLVTHTAVSSPQCTSEKRPLSNSVAFQTLFKLHRRYLKNSYHNKNKHRYSV